MQADAPVTLLWTSGWDSTFRLLSLVLNEGRTVQPYYVLDTGRQSLSIELASQEKIRAEIAKRGAGHLVLPTIMIPLEDIPPSPQVTKRYHGLIRKKWIGGQYEFIARLAEDRDLDNVEMCVLGVERISQKHLVGNVEKDSGGFRLKKELPSDDLEMFRRFSFPLWELNQADMKRIARESGWADIMDLTWFCHTPQNGKPCGRCNTCLYAMESGFASRIPLWARFKSKVRRRKPEEIHVA